MINEKSETVVLFKTKKDRIRDNLLKDATVVVKEIDGELVEYINVDALTPIQRAAYFGEIA